MEECKGDKFRDLLEDEELAALRLAALATKGTNESKVNVNDFCSFLNSTF